MDCPDCGGRIENRTIGMTLEVYCVDCDFSLMTTDPDAMRQAAHAAGAPDRA